MKKDGLLDIGSLDTVSACDAGAEIELKHPVSGVPLGIFVTVLGKDSQVFRNHTRQMVNERIRSEAVSRRRGKEADIRTLEQINAENVEILVLCTVSWRTGDKGCVLVKGEELAFNVPNAKKIYSTVPWIYDQVNDAIGDLANFIKG